MKSKTTQAIIYYVNFFWGVTWRTMTVAMLAALIIAVGLGFIAAKDGWPPEALANTAAFSGFPVAVLALAYTMTRRFFVLKTQITELYA